LTAWPGRVAQAPTARAGRARAPWSCTPCWRPSSRTARLRDQLGLDDEASSQIADGGATGSRFRGGTSVGDLPTSSVSAVQLIPEKACSAPTAPLCYQEYGFTLHTSFTLQSRFRTERRTHTQHTMVNEHVKAVPRRRGPGANEMIIYGFSQDTSLVLKAIHNFGGIGFFNSEDSTRKGGTVQVRTSERIIRAE
jgi:hypothetical protein